MTRLPPLVLLAGCSFLFTRSPETPKCSPSRAAPIADTVVASIGTVLLGLGILSSIQGCRNNDEGICTDVTTLFLVSGGVLSAAFWPSAYLGYHRASECEDLQAAAPPAPAPQ
jgi:hypothetical protein